MTYVFDASPLVVLATAERLVRDGVVSVDGGRTVVDEMVDAGWYCSTTLYRRIEQKLDDFEAEN